MDQNTDSLTEKPLHVDKTIALTQSELSMFTWSDPRSPEVSAWLAANGITQGENITVVTKDNDGVDVARRVSTNPNTFFSPAIDVEPLQGDDEYDDDFEHAKIYDSAQLKAERMAYDYGDSRTIEMGMLLDNEALGAIVERAGQANARASVKELIAYSELQPFAGLKVGESDYAFSNVFKSTGRDCIVAYVATGDEPIKPRLFYKSNSDGGWRASAGMNIDGTFSKGETDGPEYGQYVQTTKPVEAISAMLEGIARTEGEKPTFDKDFLVQTFLTQRLAAEGDPGLEGEMTYDIIGFPGMDAFVSGYGYETYGAEEGRSRLESMQLPSGMEPDFTQEPARRYGTEHTLLGSAGIDVYPAVLTEKSGSRAIEWHVAHDKDGRVWLDRLVYPDGDQTDYGTEKEVILAGALNMKPLDYVTQVNNGQKGIDYEMFSKSYADLAMTINRMPWVKRYRQATGV